METLRDSFTFPLFMYILISPCSPSRFRETVLELADTQKLFNFLESFYNIDIIASSSAESKA